MGDTLSDGSGACPWSPVELPLGLAPREGRRVYGRATGDGCAGQVLVYRMDDEQLRFLLQPNIPSIPAAGERLSVALEARLLGGTEAVLHVPVRVTTSYVSEGRSVVVSELVDRDAEPGPVDRLLPWLRLRHSAL